jgi:hypothetical protein
MKKHPGSTIALVLGVLWFISALGNFGSGLIAGPINAGPTIILGALT